MLEFPRNALQGDEVGGAVVNEHVPRVLREVLATRQRSPLTTSANAPEPVLETKTSVYPLIAFAVRRVTFQWAPPVPPSSSYSAVRTAS